MSFDAAAWQRSWSELEEAPTVRQRMVEDVIGGVLPGKSRQDIERLLGQSRQTPYFKETGRDLIYKLGPERGVFSIDSEWLLIWLDDRGRFRIAETVTD